MIAHPSRDPAVIRKTAGRLVLYDNLVGHRVAGGIRHAPQPGPKHQCRERSDQGSVVEQGCIGDYSLIGPKYFPTPWQRLKYTLFHAV
jgi:hypothetical protein